MNYTIQLNFKDGQNYIDYSNFLTATDFTKHSVVAIDGHEQSTLNVTFKADENLFRKFIESGDEVLAKVFKDGSPYFTGYIRNTNSYNINEALQPYSFQILDNSYLLDKKPKSTSLFLNNKIIDNTNTANSLIHNILNSAGISDYDISVNKSDVLNSFILTDSETYSSVLDSLMEEYGLSYSFRDDGFLTITDLYPETITPFYTLTNSDLIQPLSITKQERTNYGVKVLWTGTSIKSNQLVYRKFSDPDDKELILSGFYFPENANNVDTFQKFSNVTDSTRKFIYAYNQSLDATFDDNIIVSNEEFFSDKAKIYFTNTAASNSILRYLYNFDIRADIVVEEEEQSVLIDGDNVLEYSSQYISSETSAENLAKRLFSKQEYQNYQITFTSKNDYNVGQNVRIVDSSTGINLIVFLSSKDETENNPIKSYTAYSVGDLSFISNSIKKSVSVASNDYNTQSELNTINSSITDLNSDLSTINTSLNSISDRVTDTEDTISTTNTNISNINDDISSINSDFTAIQNRVSSAEGSIGTINSNITSINSDISINTSDILSHANSISSINTNVSSIEDDIAIIDTTVGTNSVAITQNANSISSLVSRVTTAEGTITSQGTLITQNADEISTKATKIELNSLGETVSSQGTLINQNADEIALKATKTELNSLGETVSSQGTQISQNADEIESIASRVTATESNITTHGTQINQNADEIELKATKTEVNSLGETVSNQETLITQNASDITSIASRVTTTEDNITTNATAISQNSTDISTKATKTEVNSLGQTVSSQGTSITQNADEIESIASRVTATEGTITNHGTAIAQNADEIELKATKTEVNSLGETVSSQGTAITQNASDITSLSSALTTTNGSVSSNATAISQNANDITSVASRVTTAESSISANESSITQNADSISSAVTRITDAEGVITSNTSSIQQNADEILTKVTYRSSDGNISSNAELLVSADETGSIIKLDANEVIVPNSITANEIDVTSLMAETLTVGNKINSSNYNQTDGAGFELSSEGTLTARKAILKDIRLEVGDENDKLLWVQQGQNGDSESVAQISSPRFSTSEYLSSYKESVSYNGVSGQNSGDSIIPLTNRPDYSAVVVRIFFKTTATLKFNMSKDNVLSLHRVSDNHDIEILAHSTGTYTLTRNASSTYCIQLAENFSNTDLLTNAIEIVGDNSIIFTRDPNNSSIMTFHIKKVIPLNKLSNKTLTINSSAISRYYTSINDFYNLLPAENIVYKINEANSTIYYKNELKTVSYVKKTSNSITFFFNNNASVTYPANGTSFDTSEFASPTGWGEIYGTLQLISEEKGVVVDTLLPFKNSSNVINSTIGSAASPFKAIYAAGGEFHGKCYAT